MSLSIENISIVRDGKTVLSEVSLSVEPGHITALLGANGAGKSELVLAVAGAIKISSGHVVVDGTDITNSRTDRVRRLGVSAVPEGHRVLTSLSVDENLRAAGSFLRTDLEENLDYTYEVFPELAERKQQLAGTLSGGQQQMVALGHALMSRPKYILLDEMSLGLAPLVVKRLMSLAVDLARNGMGILLIEQFTDVALAHANYVVVLSVGKQAYAGDAKPLLDNPNILRSAYLSSETV